MASGAWGLQLGATRSKRNNGSRTTYGAAVGPTSFRDTTERVSRITSNMVPNSRRVTLLGVLTAGKLRMLDLSRNEGGQRGAAAVTSKIQSGPLDWKQRSH